MYTDMTVDKGSEQLPNLKDCLATWAESCSNQNEAWGAALWAGLAGPQGRKHSASRGNGISPERQTQLFFPSLEARCWPLSLPFCSCFIYFPLWRLVFLLYRGCGTVTLCGLSIQAPRINSRVHLSSYNNQGRTENRLIWSQGSPCSPCSCCEGSRFPTFVVLSAGAVENDSTKGIQVSRQMNA